MYVIARTDPHRVSGPRLGRQSLAVALTVVILVALVCSSAQGQRSTIRVVVDGRTLEGTPVSWSGQRVLLLERNGYIRQFSAGQAKRFQQVSNGFRPFSQSEMRGMLQREFGRGFEVSGTGNYLVVHPAGQKDRWAQRFEDLYRTFVHYFAARGLRPARPEFPLVAVALHSQREFANYVRQQGGITGPGVLGFYSPQTNRVILFDATRGQAGNGDWQMNAKTIIHEATHQMAFNTRLHSRFASPPRWVAEGLAMLFEAPGVWDARHFPRQQDRINQDRLRSFLRYAGAGRLRGDLGTFVSSSDYLFSSNPGRAYSEAWALTFFLSEKEPAKYVKYLARTAARDPLRRYTPSEQLQEFTDIFGTDLKMLEARYRRFVNLLTPARP